MDNNGNNLASNGRHTNGTFAPGHSGFKKGGTPELQRETRQMLWKFFSEKVQSLPAIFDKLSDFQKARLLIETAQFFLPRQKEIYLDANVETRGPVIDYTRLSEATLKEILNATTINNGNEE